MRFYEFKILKEAEGFTLSLPTRMISPDVADLQKVLVAFGYDVGPPGVDGILGKYTKAAVAKAQGALGLPTTGKPDEQLITGLNSALAENPEIAGRLTKSTEADIKDSGQSVDVDVSIIQDPDFNRKLEKVSSELGVKSNDLIAIMKQESGVNPQAVNKSSGATGLIQFMPSTARRLGTSVEDLHRMTAVEQLDYVYKYFKMIGIKPGMGVGDLYIAVFYPAALGKDDNHVISSSGHAVYDQNKGLDRNNDGTITIADVKNSVSRFV
jgi:hypothetical protein